MNFGKILGGLGAGFAGGLASHFPQMGGMGGGQGFGGFGGQGGLDMLRMMMGQGGFGGMRGRGGFGGQDQSPINVTGLPNQPSPFNQSPNMQPMNFLGRLGGGY
jgi:hypothetical protein